MMMRGSKGLCLWVLQVTALLGLLLFFLWLILRPSDPTYAIVDYSVSKTSNGTWPSNFSFVLEITNNNIEGGIRHSDINVTLSCYHSRGGSRVVGRAVLPSSYQGHDTSLQSSGSMRLDGRLWRAVSGAAANGAMELRVGLDTTVRYRIIIWETRACAMSLQGVVPVDHGGSISANGREIELKPTRKRWRLKI